MTKRQRNKHDDRMLLKRNGWEIDGKGDYIGFNGGSESIPHLEGKLAASIALREVGYRVAGEVCKDVSGESEAEIDVLGYGHDSREIIAVEIETNCTPEIVAQKVKLYCKNEPIMDVYPFDPADLPEGTAASAGYIQGELAYV